MKYSVFTSSRLASLLGILGLTLGLSFSQTQAQVVVQSNLISELNRIVPTHPSVVAAASQANALAAEVDVARAPGNVRGGFEGGPSVGRSLSGNGVIRSSSLAAKVSVPLFDGDRVVNDVARVEQRSVAQLARVTEAQRDVASKLAVAYVEVVKRQALLLDAKAHAEHLATIADRMKRIAIVDPGRSADYNQALSRIAQQEETQALRRAELADAQGNYIAITSGLLNAPQEPHDYQLKQFNSITLNERVATAPTVQAAKAELGAELSALKVSQAWEQPVVSLDGRWGSSLSATNKVKYFDSPTVGLNVAWSTFDGGAGKASAAAAAEKVKASESQLDAVRRDLSGQVLRSLTYAQGLEGRPEAAQRAQHCADQVRVAYFKQFEVARRQLLDVLNAENDWFGQRSSAISSHYESIAARLRVAAIIGDLWPIDPSKLSMTAPPAASGSDASVCKLLTS
jgi:outer membrane protein, adhesin transport system